MTTWLTGCTGNATCVEVAAGTACANPRGELDLNCNLDGPFHQKVPVVLIRDNEQPHRSPLVVRRSSFAAFIDAVKAGAFDQLIEEN